MLFLSHGSYNPGDRYPARALWKLWRMGALRAVPDLPGRSDQEAAPQERTPDMPVLPGGGGNNNWILRSRGSHTNLIPSCLPDGSGSL